ncbi:hypothetical protein [Carnobacterium inhibens]|uniref:hypothetical protein n=1 Tax=Carnobacterium inhibens TaxID=147709 RepID=UPI00054E6582|nr:hypothetical protein [Carnobacterium inhibens]
MEIRLKTANYRYGENGEVEAVTVDFGNVGGNIYISGTVEFSAEEWESTGDKVSKIKGKLVEKIEE